MLEAMSSRLPVVAYCVGGVPEQVRAGRTGYVVERGDIELLCQRVLALAADPALRERMGEAARQRAATVFNYGRMLDSIIETYLSVVRSSGLPLSSRVPQRRPGEADPASTRRRVSVLSDSNVHWPTCGTLRTSP